MSKKKSITITSFLKNFPESKCFNKISNLSVNGMFYNQNLSYEEKYYFVGKSYQFVQRLNVIDGKFYYIQYDKEIKRTGNQFYPVIANKKSIYIDSKEIGLHCEASIIIDILKHLDITWFKDIDEAVISRYITNKIIFKRILTNKIYNEETFYKAIASSFKVSNVSWKAVREYCYFNAHHLGFFWHSLTDLNTFTRNIEESIKILYTNRDNWSKLQALSDLLNYAIQFNQIVDFTWSDRRMREEHQYQIEKANALEINSKSESPIYHLPYPDDFLFPSSIRLLNNEKDIFMEGQMMHHCLYRCYFGFIKSHDYMAFHMTSPEDCTFSIRKRDNGVEFDQIYAKYDKPVSENTKLLAEKWVETSKTVLLEMLNQPIEMEIQNTYCSTIDTDLPW